MKSFVKILMAAVTAIFLFAACGKTEDETIDVSDVKDMVFWSEEPLILYYGEGKIIIDGDFGVVVYDIENRKLTDRITYEQICEWGMAGYGNFASADGKTLYFTDMRQIDGVMTSFVSYDVESKTASDIEKIPEEGFLDGTFASKTKHYDPAEYEQYFQKYIDDNCLISGAALLDSGEFVFLSMRDGRFYELEAVVIDSGGEKVYRIFNDEE